MPLPLRNIKEDLEDLGPRFDGAPDLEFRSATEALELEKSGNHGFAALLAVAIASTLAFGVASALRTHAMSIRYDCHGSSAT